MSDQIARFKQNKAESNRIAGFSDWVARFKQIINIFVRHDLRSPGDDRWNLPNFFLAKFCPFPFLAACSILASHWHKYFSFRSCKIRLLYTVYERNISGYERGRQERSCVSHVENNERAITESRSPQSPARLRPEAGPWPRRPSPAGAGPKRGRTRRRGEELEEEERLRAAAHPPDDLQAHWHRDGHRATVALASSA